MAESLAIERTGGIAGYGSPGSRVRSRGRVALESLSEADRRSVEALFGAGGAGRHPTHPDGFVYRITRTGKSGPETVEVPEAAVPAAIVACVKDELV